MHTIARILLYFAPIALLTRLVQLIAQMPLDGANVTAQFLQSRYGVWQALHMAKDELAQLTHDQWSDDFWHGSPTPIDSAPSTALGKSAGQIAEASASRSPKPSTDSPHTQLFFYWGSDDHWIAQYTRDNIIANRARVEGKPGHERRPVMEVDSHGIGHAFCLSEGGNQIIAAKCAEWVGSLSA